MSQIELVSIKVEANETEREVEFWKNNISDEFPIKRVQQNKRLTEVLIGEPHSNCKLETRIVDSEINGKSKIVNYENVIIASLIFVNGVATGPCILNDKKGILYFKGYLENGYRQGRGQEYDKNGELIFDGFYNEGKQLKIYKIPEMKGYWKELDENDNIISICKLDDFGNKYGICYFYNKNIIIRISKWNNGKEITVIKQFNGHIMTEYRKGRKQYEGGYFNSLAKNYPRNGHGKEYKADGFTLSFDGSYYNDKKHGEGLIYKHRVATHKTIWIRGYTKGKIQFCLILFALLMVVITILCFFYNIIIGIVMSLVSLLLIIPMISKLLFHKTKVTIKKAKDLERANVYVVAVSVVPNSCNELQELNLLSFPMVESIEIGDDCFESVKTFKIDGLNQLKSLKIGKNSFTQKKNWYGNDKSKSFHILNCKSLKSIEIGEWSFSDFGGQFELKNLPSLQNFSYSSFVIGGILNDIEYIMIRSS